MRRVTMIDAHRAVIVAAPVGVAWDVRNSRSYGTVTVTTRA